MERILIAEDDEKIAWLEKDYLESNGYEARIVANGDKVIPELMQDSYDLLLLDIMLPGMSGYDICRKIREEIDIPILMVTARTESIDVIRGLGLGADDYITKPFDPSQLVARVRSHLRRYARLTGKGKEGNADGTERMMLSSNPGPGRCGKRTGKSVFPTGSLNFSVLWRRILISFFQKKSCLKRYGAMIISLTGPRCRTHQPAQGKNRGRRQKSQDHRNRLGGRLPAEPVTEGKFPAWETGRPLPMQGH